VRKIWQILRAHLQADFQAGLYISIALFLAFSIAVNYTLDLEDSLIDRHVTKPIRMVWYFLLYGFAYYGGAIITLAFSQKLHILKKLSFWVATLGGLLNLAFNAGFPWLSQLVRFVFSDYRIFSWAYSFSSNLINFFTLALPLVLFSNLFRPRENMGVTFRGVDLTPYYWILAVLVPIIAIASFEPGFKNYYPTYKANQVAEIMQWPALFPPLLYELAYGLDFFNVELMFRGFMVIALSRWLGKEAVLPMVCTYCFLHFGKPLGESISSIVGGYILGVVALYTRNIWGGVLVHMGLAWMMELAAWLQKNL